MRPSPIAVVVCVLVATAVHVSFAWWCALRALPGTGPLQYSPEGFGWPISVPADWPAHAEFHADGARWWATMRGYGWGLGPFGQPRSVLPPEILAQHRQGKDHDFVQVITVEFGLPFRSLRHSREHRRGLGFSRSDLHEGRSALTRGGWRRDGWYTWKTIPLDVMPAGFVADSLLGGALIWSITFGPFAARRAHRRRRNRCMRCGYDLKGLGTCPECGNAR